MVSQPKGWIPFQRIVFTWDIKSIKKERKKIVVRVGKKATLIKYKLELSFAPLNDEFLPRFSFKPN